MSPLVLGEKAGMRGKEIPLSKSKLHFYGALDLILTPQRLELVKNPVQFLLLHFLRS